MVVLFGTPIIRSLFIVGAFMFFSFGLWNVLLLPFSLKTLGATEFQYGLQEGLTSVGFVVGLILHGPLLQQAAGARLDRAGDDRHGRSAASCTACRRSVGVAIVLVTISGFLNSPVVGLPVGPAPAQHARARCAAASSRAFYVMRDVVFLFGMAGAGLADVVDIRLLIVAASSLLFVSAGVHARRARTGRLDLGRRGGPPARGHRGAGACRSARSGRRPWRTSICLAGRLGAVHPAVDPAQRVGLRRRGATIVDVPAGTRIVEHGDAGVVGLLHPRRLDDRRDPGR